MNSTLSHRRLALVLLGLAEPGLAACSSSSSTSTTTTAANVTTTTSANDPDLLQVQAAADTALKAQRIDTTTVTASTSTANDSWMRFVVTPKPGSTAAPLYGFAHQGATWSVVAIGTSEVGCATGTSTQTVPQSVLASFNLACTGGTTTSTAG